MRVVHSQRTNAVQNMVSSFFQLVESRVLTNTRTRTVNDAQERNRIAVTVKDEAS